MFVNYVARRLEVVVGVPTAKGTDARPDQVYIYVLVEVGVVHIVVAEAPKKCSCKGSRVEHFIDLEIRICQRDGAVDIQ